MASEEFDLLVIGAGITGAGIARDAAMRGIRTAVVDKGDFASGTSSKSSRLVHGGLRYLEMGDLRLVFEASAERKTLLRIAPHLVHPRSFIFPVYRNSRVPKWKLSIGLWAYDVLSLFRNVQRHQMLSKREIEAAEPRLGTEGLVGGARYWDAQCDDARLTLSTILSAHRNGAVAANYVRLAGLKATEGGHVASLLDEISGDDFDLRARTVVNATGPWSDGVRADGVDSLRPTKGAHIMLRRERVGNSEAITLTSAVDGRVMFVIPWGDYTYVGTTDTDDDTDPESLMADGDDVGYLLSSANAIFPGARLTEEDVLSTWAGFRPLLRPDDPRDPSSVSREHKILQDPDGMISIVGGKLTTYREMAGEVVDVVARRLKRAGISVTASAHTATEPVAGGEREPSDVVAELCADGVSDGRATHLVRHYGSAAPSIMSLARVDETLSRKIARDHPSILAEVVHACRHEMAMNLSDILIRRNHVFYETSDHGTGCLELVAEVAGGELDWTENEKRLQIEGYLREVGRMENFRTGNTPGSRGNTRER